KPIGVVALPSEGGRFELVRVDAEVLLRTAGGSTITRIPLAALSNLRIDGSPADDTLVVDFSGGNPIPSGGLTFLAGDQTTRDTLELTGGTFTSIAHTFTGAESGTVDLDGSQISYGGLEPIADNLNAVARVFTYGGGPDVILLEDDATQANNQSKISTAGTGETVTFVSPANSLTVNAGAGRDRVVVRSLDSRFSASLTINGQDDRDTLVGGSLAETLDGGPGDDRVLGLGGDDSLLGGDGNDYLRGYSGNDTLDGGAGDDSLLGTDGDDLLVGGAGDDTLDGQTDNDRLYGAGGNDSLVGGPGNDYVDGQGSSYDTVRGGPGNDTLKGGSGTRDQLVERGDADYTLTDTSLSGQGEDIALGFERAYLKAGGSDNMLDARGFSGWSTLVGAAGNDTLVGGLGRDRIGNIGDDLAYGSASRDSLYGSAGQDTLNGQGSNDILRGGPGDDLLMGNRGIDNLGGGPGRDTLHGGDGTDLVVEAIAVVTTGKLQVTDTQLSDLGDPAEVDELISIEQARLYGSNNSDVLDASGFSGPTWLFGFAGDDTLVGGIGADYLDGGAGNDGLSGQGGADTLYGRAGNDVLLGGDGNDLLVGDVGMDTLLGLAGDDEIDAADG
ncbi:MAG: calcium-binding protein, partial [Planctomycetes bacterium]|nr:calcium-binding protein [Planctomycetota bacterium]